MAQKYTIRQSGALNNRGMALILCLLLMTTLCLIGGAALGISRLNHKIVHNATKQVQAFYLAEAGRETVLAFLREDPLWRGGAVPFSGVFKGGFDIGGIRGEYSATLIDCTADENGIYSPFLPAGHILLKSTGVWIDAVQTVTCIAWMTPKEGTEAAFPRAAVVSSGPATGPLVTLDDLGDEDSLMLRAPVALPAANPRGLRAMADMSVSSLDNDTWDASLDGITSFWQDPPANTRPRILYVQGDLEISGARRIYGIVFVEGKQVAFEGESGIVGVLYAPNATFVTVQNTGASGRVVSRGQFVTGSGGVSVSGNPVSFQHDPDYVDAFNTAAASKVEIDVVPGSWGML